MTTTITPAATLDSFLLDELRLFPRTPADLRAAVASSGYDVSPDEVLAGMRRLRQRGLVDGTSCYGDTFTMWLTAAGTIAARDAMQLGEWRPC